MTTVPARLNPGLWTILTTPFTSDASRVDHHSMARQIHLAHESGSDGLVVLGVFGEASSLSLLEQRQVVATAAHEAGHLPLVVGIASRSTVTAMEQADNALAGVGDSADTATLMVQINSGVTGVVVDHLEAIHAATGASIVLQDYPAASGVHTPTSRVMEVAGLCSFVTAIKAEAPPTPQAIAELTAATWVPVFGGLGGVGLLDELNAGAGGVMTGFSHPEGLRAAIDAYQSGGFAAARSAWQPWLPLANFEAQHGIGLALRKMLLHRRGILQSPAVRPPSLTMPPVLQPLLEDHLAAVSTLERAS
ncbi:dihydrodipicolinate synthase family protein [Cellulosimicrobium funkei]|nr:dihydrodipicolinate synthase family protein [Cellulosimicrobium funkei]